MKLVLFDIDGTLLRSDGAGRRALHHALRTTFGTVGPEDHWFDGKTDPQIIRELMRHERFSDADIDARIAPTLAHYVERLRVELHDPRHEATLLPGIPALLDALAARADVVLGLLTGNIADGARAKLERVGLAFERFTVGAFGSDHEIRPELPAIAQRRCREVHGCEVAGSDVVVIGDTPADVTCGRGIGARAIAVATGRYEERDLEAHGPYRTFPDLAATGDVVAAICAA